MKTKNLIYLALAGAGIYFIYNKMKKKQMTNKKIMDASAVKKNLTSNIKKEVSNFDASVREA